MAGPVKLRILINEDDARKLILQEELPRSIEDLSRIIAETFELDPNFRLQYRDEDFGGEFVNLTSMTDVQDKGTLKVIKTVGQNQETNHESLNASQDAGLVLCSTPHRLDDSGSLSSYETDDTVILSSPEGPRSAPWPLQFPIPVFSFDSEMVLQEANAEYQTNGTRLTPSHKLKSHILESLSDEIIKFKAYPTDVEFNSVAEALVKKHPCLKEPASFNGCYGWKISLKYKMANLRTKLRSIGCSEVSINSKKNKDQGQQHAVSAIKKPRRAEVNYLPQHPKGETTDSLENERMALLNEMKKRNIDKEVIKDKMDKTFSVRRQEVVKDKPMVSEFKNRWPGLFSVSEINNEFARITTVQLEPRFFGALDKWSDALMRVFRNKGGVPGQTMRLIMQPISQNNTLDVRRECILKALCVYLNEDPTELFREYTDCEGVTAENEMAQTVMGIYIIRHEGHEPGEVPKDIGVLLEGAEAVTSLRSVASAMCMFFGLIYALNVG